jgi:metal-responsive CopG/Arc/MetJ family transcriptional regulator
MMYYHTQRNTMAVAKIAITISEPTLAKLDRLVKERKYPNRSRAIQEAVEEKVAKFERNRLADALELIDPAVEKHDAEEGMQFEAGSWPTY